MSNKNNIKHIVFDKFCNCCNQKIGEYIDRPILNTELSTRAYNICVKNGFNTWGNLFYRLYAKTECYKDYGTYLNIRKMNGVGDTIATEIRYALYDRFSGDFYILPIDDCKN